jgi:hypothetical protein
MAGMDDKRLQDALEQVRTSRDEAEKFTADPEAYLQSKGVDTEGLKFAPITAGDLSDEELELAAGGKTVCTSVGGTTGVGVTVCSSVGDDVEAY